MTDSTVGGAEPNKSPIRRFFDLEPAILRGVLVALAAIIAQGFNLGLDLDRWVELVINLFSAISAFLATWWTRGVVVPTAKVLAFKKPSGAIVPGGAVAETPLQVEATIDAATKEAA